MRLRKKFEFENNVIYPVAFSLIFLLILVQYPLNSFESLLYDFRVKYDFIKKESDQIVLITLDEESDDFLGDAYPYSYATHLKLIKQLTKDNPKAVGYFVNFAPPLSQEKPFYDNFVKELKEYQTQKGIVRIATEIDEMRGELIPPAELQEIGYSLGQINEDNFIFARDGVVRRAILNVSGEDSVHLWLSNSIRQKSGQDKVEASNVWGRYYNEEADANFVLFKYLSNPEDQYNNFKKIPFHRALVGRVPEGFFKDKIVLIGANYFSQNASMVRTPFMPEEERAPKLVVHAEILASLLSGKTIASLPKFYSDIITIVLAIFLSAMIFKLKPKDGLLVTLFVLVSLSLMSYLAFIILGIWIYMAHLLIMVLVVYYVQLPFRAIGEYQRRFALQEEAKILKQVDKLKQNFLSLMSHDLKTPVAKIAGLVDISLMQFKDNPELNLKLNHIKDATKELNKFISSILEITKIESSNLELAKVNKDINPIIEGVLDELRFEASQKEIELEQELAPLYPVGVDITLFRRIVSNLVENALKYSGTKTTVRVKTWDDEKWVYVEVEDNGVGISSDEIGHIFEKFYRVKNDASHSIKGSGLGLYLVKYFVELQGGEISAQSMPGQYTKFLVKLPNQSV